MNRRKALLAGAVLAFAAAALPVQAADKPDHLVLTPKELKWADVPSLPKGAKAALIEGPMSEAGPFMVRLKFPANYKLPPHWHNNIEHVTVLSGTLNMGIGDKFDQKKTHALGPGHVSIMQPKTKHYAWTKVETIAQVHGIGPWEVTYVNPDDDPRKNAKAQ